MITNPKNQHKRSKRHVGATIGLCIITVIGIYLLISNVHVIYAIDDDGNNLIVEQVNADTTLKSSYIHSVARCPMIEKFEVNDTYELVLTESWNCSFGAGIEAETPSDATIRMEDGYYIYENINQAFSEVSFHSVALNEQTITIDDKTWEVSEEPFVGKTFSITIKSQSRLTFWWNKF